MSWTTTTPVISIALGLWRRSIYLKTSQAMRQSSAQEQSGKGSISFQNPDSIFQERLGESNARLDTQESYLLVGYLGAHGRSISRWMIARGAQDFVLIGRLGLDKPLARPWSKEPEATGAIVKVAPSDVSNLEDISPQVESSKRPWISAKLSSQVLSILAHRHRSETPRLLEPS